MRKIRHRKRIPPKEMETYNLEVLAKQIMHAFGLQPEFPKAVYEQLLLTTEPAHAPKEYEDLRSLLWCSIDNDDSRDLDQLTFAQKNENGDYTLFVAIADVDALVTKGSAIDHHAQINTTSVYTPAKTFSMLPEKLSTDLTSLNEAQDRVALVVKMTMNPNGEITDGSIFQALVQNHAKLTYNGVGDWLEGQAPIPEKIVQVPGLEEALQCQHEAAQMLKQRRHSLGALTLESPEAEAKIIENTEVILELPQHNFASQLIEHFMIAANGVMANTLKLAKIPSLRRVVRVPKRWDRIVEIASSLKETLPEEPNSKALENFLVKRKKADPESFPDLSLTVIKLLGRGEYIVENPGDTPIGHFGLALPQYAHTTAPNRRFPDLIAQRQYKACLKGSPSPYSLQELQMLADHCTKQEDASIKVERHMNKSAAALLLSSHIGTEYHGIVTGAGSKGTWVRVFDPPVEGKIIQGFEKLDVGDRVFVMLESVDVPRGYINFVRAKK